MQLIITTWIICLAAAILIVVPNPILTKTEKIKVIIAIVLLFTVLLVGGRYAVGEWGL